MKIHDYFQDSGDTRRMWQGIQVITNYKTTSPACDHDASLPDALNHFYARFEAQNNVKARKSTPLPNDQVLCLTTAEARKTLCRVNPRKPAGPDNIPGRVLTECTEQLADVFTDIFNISLSSNIVPTCLKATTIVPVPKKSTVSCLNDYRPVALTPIVMKCFERFVMRHIKSQLPTSMDPHAVCDSYVRMLFIDFSSAFNTIIPQHFIEKLSILGLNTSLCNWILDFLTGRPISITTTLSTGAPQGLEIVKSTKFLGVHLADNLTWSVNISSITKKAQQRLYFLRRLRKANLPPPILTMFYRGTIESILSSCITAWFGKCTVADRKTPQRIVRTAEKIIGFSFNDSSSVWRGVKAISNYKTPSPSSVENQRLADDLNEFYCRFERSPFTPPITPVPPTPEIQFTLRALLCQWITSFLTDRQQLVRLGKLSSSTHTISTGAPQGCVLSPLLFSLYTNDCTSKHPSVKLLKFADDTTLIGLIQDGDESAYRLEVEQLAVWCGLNNLELNTLKTVEMIVDFRRTPPALPPLTIMDSTVTAVESFRFLGTTISQDLKWDIHIDSIVKKAQQRLYFLRQLKKFNLPQELLKQFYSAIIESILCTAISVWFSSATQSDLRRLRRVVRTAERIIGIALPSLQELYLSKVRKKAKKITLDPSHPAHSLFELFPSGRR
ncbi:hypothetical protein Q8A73_017214 [Channa argus]|nr:hypothetical protein Q8A73_017214 [Channa argus]